MLLTSHLVSCWLSVSVVALPMSATRAISQSNSTYEVFTARVASTAWQEPVVTLDVHNVPRSAALDQIVAQSGLALMWSGARVALTGTVSVSLHEVPVHQALAVILHGTGAEAKLSSDGRTIFITRSSAATSTTTHQAVGIVSGRVTDSASGQGLGGAQVSVAGIKGKSAVTSDSGNFTLRDVPVGDQVLMIRLFGYRPADRTVTVVDSQRTMVRVVMVPVPTVLSGVVTTATGLQRKIEVGNDITSLNVDSIMRVAPVTSVTDLLETRVPGLTVMHSSGDPGNPSRLRLRGVGSITGNNDPIVVVDGVRVYSSQSDSRNDNLAPPNSQVGFNKQVVGGSIRTFAAPSPIDQIDPNNIETIEVFKGPSASALYGSDAANGVIVITTKHGRAGPTQWTMNLGDGVNWIPGSWPTNYFRFGVNANNQGPVCNWYDISCVVIDSVRAFQALNDSRYTVLSHGGNQSADLSVSGGTATLQYNLTGSGSGQQGNLKLPELEQQRYTSAFGGIPGWMVRPDNYTTWGIGGALTAVPTQTLRATFQSSVFNSSQQTSSLQTALTQLQGAYVAGGYATYADGALYNLTSNALVNGYVEQVTSASLTTQNNLTLSWQPRSWLPITATGGLQTVQRNDKSYIPYGVSSSGPSGCGAHLQCGTDTTGYYGAGRGQSHNQTLTVGTVLPLFQQRISMAVGGNYYSETTNDFQASTNQLAPGVSTPDNFISLCGTIICGTSTQGASSDATYGWYVEPRFNIASRFFAAPGFRLDGGSGGSHATSSGGAAGGLSAFPKLDLSYVAIDRQSGHPMWGFVSMLRPRVAFGLAGTQPAPEQRLRLFSSVSDPSGSALCSTFPLNGVTVPGACLTSLGNTQLHPERSSELELGFDATLWNGRVSMTYTQYNKTRKDAIIQIPVAPSIGGCGTGYSLCEINKNIGEVRNTGTELTANVAVIESRALSWNVGANLSNNNNVLVHLNPGQTPDRNLGIVPGYPLFGTWVKPILSFADQNQDGIIEPNEVKIGDSSVFVGSPNPKYELNLTTNLHLLNGRLGVYATFAYQNGLTQNNQAALLSQSFLMLGNNPSTPLAYQAAIQADACPSGGCTSANSTPYGLIQTVNAFRFSEFSVNYELPRSAAAWFKVPRMSIALQGSNLGLHTNYRGKDPDVNAFSTVSAADETADLGQIPEPRTWWLKLTLGN